MNWERQQLEAVRKIWSDATSDIPYYRNLVASGRAPEVISSWSDYYSIPVLTRQAIQDQPAQFLRLSGPPDGVAMTAGSTGTPLQLGMNQAERDRMRVVKISSWQEFGYEPHSRLFLIWGHAHLLGTGWRGTLGQVKRQLADAFLGYCRVSAYRLNKHSCEGYAKQLLRFRPTGIIGYAAAVDLFARYTAPFRERFRALGLRFVLITSEAPPHQDTVAILEDAFGCPVIQEYGGVEFGQLAFKGRTGRFEVYSDLNVLECEPALSEDHNAYPALLTTIYPRYVPLVRYRLGDALLSPERLAHGHVARFDAIAGRVHDVIQLEGGDYIHSMAVFHCMHQEPSIHNIQMVLRDDGIDILLVSSASNRDVVEKRLRLRLSQVHPALGSARFSYVEDLQLTHAGKRRWFVDYRTGAVGRRGSVHQDVFREPLF